MNASAAPVSWFLVKGRSIFTPAPWSCFMNASRFRTSKPM
jgi:hypothetical protein